MLEWQRIVDPVREDQRSADEVHVMDVSSYAFVFIYVLFKTIGTGTGKLGDLKVCVVGNPRQKSTRTTKYCDLLGKSKRTPVSCVYAPDRLGCLLAVTRRKADFSVFEPEDLYFSTLWDESSVLVVSEIRELKKKPFRYGIVALVRKDSNISGTVDLRGKRLCHPGTESGPEWTDLISQYFEERVAPANCDESLSIYEDRIRTTAEFFGSGCKAGPWSLNEEEDARLKKEYWNLCALCDGGDCSPSDKYRGSGGSLICFEDGIGDVLWTKYEDVKAHFKFLSSDSIDPSSKFSYLCDDGSLMPLSTEEPCLWLAKPWQVIAANRKSATDVQKVVELLSDTEHNDWQQNLLHVIELYLESIQNVMVSRTPEDYLRRIPGYLSASAMSQGNCKPMHSVNFCISSGNEKEKCEWMSKAGAALGVRPSLECIQKPNVSSCLDSVAKKETDVVSVAPDFFYDAAVKYNLRVFLLETGARQNDSYITSVLVRKKSGLKSLSDLKGKKLCLTRKGGIGWWNLLFLLQEESLIGSRCSGLGEYFGKICSTSNEDDLEDCCPSDNLGDDDDADVFRCLLKDGCDAAISDFNSFKEFSEDEKVSDVRAICDSQDKSKFCHWMWSHPHYLMTSADESSPKSLEILNVFYQLGQYFGKNSRKNNAMLEIFGPFHQINNVLFKDVSTSFVKATPWNFSNNFQNALEEIKICSKSSQTTVPASLFLLYFAFYYFFYS